MAVLLAVCSFVVCFSFIDHLLISPLVIILPRGLDSTEWIGWIPDVLCRYTSPPLHQSNALQPLEVR